MRPTSSMRCGLSFARQARRLAALTSLVTLPLQGIATPQGSTVVAGNVAFASGAGTLDITQTGQAAIVNWQDFSIGAGETVTINQAANAALLNRVTGANPSELLGQLHADGRVYLINPNGVVIGAGANINVQEFIASTQDVGDAEFLDFANGDSDNLIFDGDSTASITNAGTITAADGDVIFVGYKVANSGAIHADNGVAGLAAGKKVWFKPQSAQHIIIESSVSDPGADAADGTGVNNSGNISAIQAELKAAAANVYALAINQTGVIEATGVANRNGRILLTTDEGTVAHASGSLTAHNADGSGGEVLVGGDYHGLDPSSDDNGIYLAASTTFGAGATIDVSASAAEANGGRAVVWANEATVSAGTINAQGGASGGDGGYVVVAGHEELNHTGSVDVSAAAGEAGTLVLGLPTATIADAAAHDTADGVIANAALATQLASANVTIDAFGNEAEDEAGDIAVNADLTWSSTNRLTLKAGESVAFNAGTVLSAPNATVELQVTPVSTDDTVTVDATATLTASSLVIGQNADSEYIGFNPEPEQYRTLGNVIIDGVLTVNTLDLKIENAGIGPSELAIDNDAISIANPANDIGTLTSSVNNTAGGATINGRVHIVDGVGNLTIAGDFSGLAAGEAEDFGAEFGPDWPPLVAVTNTTTLTTAGTLTLASGARLASAGDDTDIVLSAGGGFVNQAGASAVMAGTGGRFLIYSDDPANLVTGGLTGAPVYDKTFAANAPASITQTGNRFLYRLAPTLTFTANDLSRLYGAANPTLAFTVTGLVGGDAASAAYTGTPTLSTTALASDDVGTATIAIAAGTVTATDYDYKIAFAPGTLTIDPAPLTITADDLSRTEGNANPTLTATFSGLVNGDTAADISGLDLATTALIGSVAGTYPITVSGATNPNYDITFVDGILTVNGVPTLIITADSFDIRYGAPLPDFTSTITGFVGEDDESIVSGLTLTSTAAAGSPVGTYDIVPDNATAAGYEINYVNGTLKIDPALLTITANSFNRTYGSTNPDLGVTYTGFVNDEDESLVSGLTIETSATASSNVGDYAITVADATAPNYEITFVPGKLTIDRAPLTIDVDNLSKVYADPNPTLTATTNGLVLGQSLTDPGLFALTTTATQFTDVGNVAITATATGAGADNYDATINPGALAITPRPVTVRLGSGTREYGETNPTITLGLFGTEPEGTSNFFNNNVTRGTVTTAATPSSDVGTYATSVTDMTAANPNFAITVEEGTLTVTPAPLTVRANNASRLYGATNPAFTGTATGLKLSDTLADVLDGSFTTSATVTSDVGTYAITAGGSLLTDNYTVSFVPGTLTVNKAPLFIVPGLASRFYGDPDPDFTLVATGLLNGDTVDVVTQEQFSGSPPTAGVGSQTITILGATAKNYDLTFGPGTLNILPRPITITAADATREYGEANPAFTFSIDNLASFDTSAAIPDLAVTTVATTASSVVTGGYALNATSGANPNYAISYVSGRLTITPVPLRFGAGSLERIYGQASPDIGADVVTGLKLSDTADLLGVSVNGPAPTADVGTYPITVSITNPNYTVVGDAGEMRVLPAPIDVAVGNVVRRYGDANPSPSTVPVTVSGLAFGQTAEDVLSLDFGVDATARVGNYPINAELISPNYQIAGLTLGNLAVLTRQIALKPANVVRYYGDENPAYRILVAGDGLASFDTIDDVAFSDLLIVDSTLTDALPSPLTDAGLFQTRIQSTGNPNYEVISVPGLFVILPRPITLTTADATATENRAPPTFVTTATNLVAGHTVQSLFPDLTYNVYEEDAPAAVGVPLTPDTYPIPDEASDAAFRSNYPSEPAESRPPGEGGSGGFTEITVEFPPIPEPTLTGGTIKLTPEQLLGFKSLVNPALLGEQPTDDPQPVINYIQPFGYQFNTNYVVTAVHNGTLTIEPDPVIVAEKKAAAEAAAAENALANNKAFYLNPPDGYSAFGLPNAALPALVDAIHFTISNEGGSSELKSKIEELLGNEPGSGFSEADLYALLANIPFIPEVKAAFVDALSGYVRELASRPADHYSASDIALVGFVQARMQQTQNALVAAAKAEQAAWLAEQRVSHAGMNMANLFGQDMPYGKFLDSAVQQTVENQITTNYAGMGVSAGGKVAGTVGASGGLGGGAFAAAGELAEQLLPYRFRAKARRNLAKAKANSSSSSNAAETAGEAGGETAGEAGAETGAEAGTEVAVETGAEAGTEVAVEAGGEAAIEAGTVAVETGVEAGTAAAEVGADAAVAAGEAAAEGVGFIASTGAIVATAVVAAVVVSTQRAFQVAGNMQQQKVFKALVAGDNQDIHLSGLNLNTEKGSPGSKMQAKVNEAILNLALTELFGG